MAKERVIIIIIIVSVLIISLPAIEKLSLSRQTTFVWKENVPERSTAGVPFSLFVFPSPAGAWQAELFRVNTGSRPQKM